MEPPFAISRKQRPSSGFRDWKRKKKQRFAGDLPIRSPDHPSVGVRSGSLTSGSETLFKGYTRTCDFFQAGLHTRYLRSLKRRSTAGTPRPTSRFFTHRSLHYLALLLLAAGCGRCGRRDLDLAGADVRGEPNPRFGNDRRCGIPRSWSR